MYSFPARLRTICSLALLFATVCAATADGSGGVNAPAQLDKPHVVLVSIDGFRHDFRARFDTPTLDRIAASGVHAHALIPVYPTLTFPNHYSIATGLYPGHHGLVDNTFFNRDRTRRYTLSDRNAVQDGSWYGGEPLWVVAEKSGMVTAAYFFVGTEADVQGIRPTYWKPFNASIPGEDRVEQVLDWLAMPADERPHLVTLYFEDVDVTAHRDGVRSPTVGDAVARVDTLLGQLLDGIDSLPVADDTYVIVVSDHGQSYYRYRTPFILEGVIDLTGIRVVDHGTSVSLFFAEPDRARAAAICNTINSQWRHGQAFMPGEGPVAWRVGEDSRFADVIVQADPQAAVASRPGRSFSEGDHGWPPGFRDMHGIFFATGPRLPQGRRIDAFENVHIYPLVLALLGLEQSAPIDGDPDTLLPLLEDE